MSIEALNTANWKDLFDLSAEQSGAVVRAIQIANANEAIARMLEEDFRRLCSGVDGEFCMSEEYRREVYGESLYRLHSVLVLIMRLPWLIEQYRSHGIPEKILRDTLSDVRIWMDVCQKKTGYPGLLEYGWLKIHFSFKLFRLGRLQFIAQPSEVPVYVYRHRKSGLVIALCPDGSRYYENGDAAGVNGQSVDGTWQADLRCDEGFVEGFPIHRSGYAVRQRVRLDRAEWELALKPGDPVLDMHIAEGCPLEPEAVGNSLAMAPEFFRKHMGIDGIKAFICMSWLMDDNIGQMQPKGNIAAFQQRFHLVPHVDSSDWQTRQRAFGNPDVDILKAECTTSLQRSIAAWYAAGRYCRHAAGFILL